MNRNYSLYVLLASSVLLLLGAYAFEIFGELLPCQLCLWQRAAHFAVILLAVIALRARRPFFFYILSLLAMAVGTAIAIFHAGVEAKIWQGLASCSAPDLALGGVEEMMKALSATPIIRCDVPLWVLFGVSMAGWNAILSCVAISLSIFLWTYHLRASRLSNWRLQ